MLPARNIQCCTQCCCNLSSCRQSKQVFTLLYCAALHRAYTACPNTGTSAADCQCSRLSMKQCCKLEQAQILSAKLLIANCILPEERICIVQLSNKSTCLHDQTCARVGTEHKSMCSYKQRLYTTALCSASGHVPEPLVALLQYSITLYFTTCFIMQVRINKGSLLSFCM